MVVVRFVLLAKHKKLKLQFTWCNFQYICILRDFGYVYDTDFCNCGHNGEEPHKERRNHPH